MNQNSKITLSAVCATFLLSNANANNTPANEIANKVVRLDKAKEKNPTIDGTGIVVGIIDGPFNLKNPIIKDQAYTDPINNKIEPNYFSGLNNASDMRHGTNVTSIIVGDGKNYTQKEAGSGSYIEQNTSLKGVAYKSKFYGIAYNNPGATYNSNNLESDIQKLADAGVKVINFSAVNHNKLGFALLNRKIDDGVEYIDDAGNKHLSQKEYQEMLRRASVSWELNTKTSKYENTYGLRDFATIQQSVQKNGMLLVTGSGNDGFVAPRTSSSMAAYDESYRELLVVGGLNSAQITISEDVKKWKVTGITQDKVQSIIDKYKTGSTSNGTSVSISTTEDGKKNFAKRVVDQVVAQQGIYYAGNLFKGTSLYSIVAPAQNVAVANGAYQYVSKETERDQIITQNSGTSFATPYASGVAALVQQKYSFLTGAQLADVLLSTANSDVELPDMLVLSSNNGTAYTVVYVDNQNNNDVPKKKEDGSIDTEQVKKDLMGKLGLKYNKAIGGFNNLNEDDLADYIVKNLSKSKKDAAETHTASLDEYAVVKLSKEEIIGQGILDANKALNGLARLDINRMNKEDIQSYTTIKEHSGTGLNNNQTETKTYGFYTIDTKGYDGTNAFTNDIEERKWDNKYHLNDAINSLKDVQGKESLQAGLIKTGEGTLTFKDNTLRYNGPTIAKGGTLKLENVTVQSSALYADGGTIQIVASQATSANNTGTKAQKNIYARNGGVVDIASNATLLEGNVYALNGGIVGGKGTITQNLRNDSGVVFAGFMPDTDSIEGGEKLSVG
ncbi:MAG: S8 family serine peptidase, partial [Helicobacter sp.]|nr:S8 family serine peptidase [Helicobacter sp.]